MPRVRISENALARSVEDQMVVLNLETGECHVLNGVAARMWSILREGGEPEAIVDRLLEEYDVEAATLRRDVDEFLDALLERGLARDQTAGAG